MQRGHCLRLRFERALGGYRIIFFQTESVKSLISQDLFRFGLADSPQNIENKNLAGKIFWNKDLGVSFGR
jgi:hypothetical protein